MSKELPYFKFYPSEWITGNISLLDERTKGLFTEICAYYWSKNGDLTNEFISKKIIRGSKRLKVCMDLLLKVNMIVNKKETITIKFLDEQLMENAERHRVLSEAGRRGGKATPKPPLNHPEALRKEEDKIRQDNIKELENSEIWFEDICMKKGYKMNWLKSCLKEFIADQELKGEMDRPINDIKSHFVNYLKIQFTKIPEGEKKTKYPGNFYKDEKPIVRGQEKIGRKI